MVDKVKERARKRSKEEIFVEKAERLAKTIGTKYDELADLAKRGGYDQPKITALFEFMDKRSDKAAEAFKRGLEGGKVEEDDFSLVKAAEAVAADGAAQ